MKTLITNGHIVTAVDSYIADILIEGETIALIGKDLAALIGDVDRTIDATNKLVIPGGIDPHTHMDLPLGLSIHRFRQSLCRARTQFQ